MGAVARRPGGSQLGEVGGSRSAPRRRARTNRPEATRPGARDREAESRIASRTRVQSTGKEKPAVKLPLEHSRPEDEVTVTQEHVHVIRMSAKVPPLTPDHIRQARARGTDFSPPGPQEDHRDPPFRRRVWWQSLRGVTPPRARPTRLSATTVKHHRRFPLRTSFLRASVR